MKNNNQHIVIRLLLVCLMTVGISISTFSQDNSVVVPNAYGQGVPVNYIRTWDALAPQTDPNVLIGSAPTAVRQTTQYLDGLGRPIQVVVKQGSYPTGGSASDMVSAMVYDSLGREVRKYLPFAANTTGSNTSISDGLFKPNPFQQQQWFYSDANNGSPVKGQSETYYYGKTEYEASPLSRPLKTFAPGNAWVNQGRGVEAKYWINKAADSVRIWTVTDSSNTFGGYASSAIYAAGELYKTVTIDEQGNQSIEFKDKEGQIILKKVKLTATDNGSGSGHVGWLCTYYIYDGLNQLRAVVQPRGVELLMANSWNTTTLSGAILSEQCFRYEYDDLGRMIMKKVPGAGAVYMVYDIKNRSVLSQDANMRGNNKWSYILYDNLNRPVETGLLNSSSSRSAHQGAATAAGAAGYPNLSGQTYEMLTQTFYDNYDWFGGSKTHSNAYDVYGEGTSSTVYPYPQAITDGSSNILRGLVTGMVIKILDTSTYALNFNFYDSKGRLIQTQKTGLGGASEVITTQYTWSGLPYVTISAQSKDVLASQTNIVVTKNTYDNLGRVIKVEKKVSNTKVNGGVMSSYLTIAENEYDALGRLRTKKIGRQKDANGNYTTMPIDTLSYDYNIRGWLLGVNRDYAKSVSSTSRYFGFDLGYNKTGLGSIGSYAGPGLFNGNITGMLWKSSGDAQIRKYDFNYDNANRLLKADFNQYTSGAFNKNAGIDFSIKMGNDGTNPLNAYDANGNILKMQQWGWRGAGSQQIDSLIYTYYANTNRLMNVIDGKNNASTTLGDFHYPLSYYTNKPSNAQDYSYDGNGNLTSDFNKDITAQGIIYNHLNLPQTVFVTNKGNVYYTYDALGNKLKKVVTEGGTTTTTLYQNGLVYKNDTLEFITMEEGRIRFNSFQNKLYYDYFIKDHLGNVRMVLTEQKDTAFYPAVTFEDVNTTNEQLYYENANLERTARPANFNSSAQNGSKVQLLRKNTSSIGAGKLLKVMAKDRIHAKVDYYIINDYTNNSNANGLSAVITYLASLLNSSPVTAGFHGSGSTITNNLNSTSAFTTLLAPQGSGQSSPMPKAYLNILFFDEQFKFVEQQSEIIQVNTKGSAQVLMRSGDQAKTAYKNGYVYVYVSNESNNLVYFDNLQVSHERGPITEETHYYPFGLTMGGISSRALSFGKENKYKFNNGTELQNNEFSDGSGLELYATPLRNLDPQLGRWWQIDSKPDYAQSLYSSMGNNPILYNDPLGDTVIPGAGFWRNAWEGIKDGGRSTVGFVKSLGTVEGWKNVGQGLLELQPATNFLHAVKGEDGFYSSAVKSTTGYVSNISNMTKDQIGHDLGFGLEKTGEAVLLSKGAGAVSNAVKGVGSTTLYRAGSAAEVADVSANGVRNTATGYSTGKLFATTAADAAEYGKANFGLDGVPNTIMKVKVPNSVMKTATTFEADAMKAVSIPEAQLPKVRYVSPLNYSPKPTNPFGVPGW